MEDLVKMLDSEEEMIAADYRIPMSIGEAPHAEVFSYLIPHKGLFWIVLEQSFLFINFELY